MLRLPLRLSRIANRRSCFTNAPSYSNQLHGSPKASASNLLRSHYRAPEFLPAASAEGPKDFETRPAGALPATSNAVAPQLTGPSGCHPMPLRRNGFSRDAQAGGPNVRRDCQRPAMFARVVSRQTSSPRGRAGFGGGELPGRVNSPRVESLHDRANFILGRLPLGEPSG